MLRLLLCQNQVNAERHAQSHAVLCVSLHAVYSVGKKEKGFCGSN